MVEVISLAAAIFWDPNFALFFRHILNLAKKLGFKTKKLRAEMVNKRIRQIWAKKIIAELNLLFINNLEWRCPIAIIFTQPKNQNIK